MKSKIVTFMEQIGLFPHKVAEVYIISYDRINSPVFASEKAAKKFLTKKSKVKPWVNSVWCYEEPSCYFDIESKTLYACTSRPNFSLNVGLEELKASQSILPGENTDFRPSFGIEQYAGEVPAGFKLAGAVTYAWTKLHDWGYYLRWSETRKIPEGGVRTIIIPVLKLDDIKKIVPHHNLY